MRRRLIPLALAFLASSLWAERAKAGQGPRPEDVQVTIVAGGMVSMASEAEADVNPFARVGVELPLSDWSMTPRLHIRLDLSALPGEAMSLSDPTTFRSAEFYGAVCQPIHPSVYVDACLGGGAASRIPGDLKPSDRAVLWGEAHVRFGRTGRGWLDVGLGRDQRLDGLYRWAFFITGAIKLYVVEALKGSLQLVGDVVASLEAPQPGGPRTTIYRIGVAVGR